MEFRGHTDTKELQEPGTGGSDRVTPRLLCERPLGLPGDDGDSRNPQCCGHRAIPGVPNHPPALSPLLHVGPAVPLSLPRAASPAPRRTPRLQPHGHSSTASAPGPALPGHRHHKLVPEEVFPASALPEDALERCWRWQPRQPTAEQHLNARLMNREEHRQRLKIKGTRCCCCRQEPQQLHRDLYCLIMHIKLLQTFLKADSALCSTDVNLLPMQDNPPTHFFLLFYSFHVFLCSLNALSEVPVCATAPQHPDTHL